MFFLNRDFIEYEITYNEIKLKELILFTKSDSFLRKVPDILLRDILISQIDILKLKIKLLKTQKRLILEENLQENFNLNISNINALIALWKTGDYDTTEELIFKWFDLGNLNLNDISFFITFCSKHLRIVDTNYKIYNKQQKIINNICEVLI